MRTLFVYAYQQHITQKSYKLCYNRICMPKAMSEKPLFEITLRKYEHPHPEMEIRDVVKRICLSLGFLNPGDSRDAIVDTLAVLALSRKPLTSQEIMKEAIAYRKKHKLENVGLTYTNVCRQLRKLRQLMLVEVSADKYRITENETFSALFEEKITSFVISNTTKRIKEYLEFLDEKIEKN